MRMQTQEAQFKDLKKPRRSCAHDQDIGLKRRATRPWRRHLWVLLRLRKGSSVRVQNIGPSFKPVTTGKLAEEQGTHRTLAPRTAV